MFQCDLCIQVSAKDLVEVCTPHLSSAVEDQAEAALRAVNSICGLPMMPLQRSTFHQRLLTFLASSSDLSQRPLMRARIARAVIENSGLNLLKPEHETCSMMHVRFLHSTTIRGYTSAHARSTGLLSVSRFSRLHSE
jgi:hypothetical protein